MAEKILDDLHMEIIKEIGNIGSGRVAMGLANYVGSTINIDITKPFFIDRNLFDAMISGLGKKIYSINFVMKGDFSGGFIAIFPKGLSEGVISNLKSQDMYSLNVLMDSYVSSIQQYLNCEVDFTFDGKYYEGIQKEVLGEVFENSFSGGNGKFLLVSTRCWLDKMDKSGHFYMYFNSSSLDKMLENLDNTVSTMM